MDILQVSDRYFLTEVLLNFFIILIPIFFFHRIIPMLHTSKGKIYLGLICGFSAFLSMLFPIVHGNDFLWDLRWIALTVSILYGGIISWTLTAGFIIIYRYIISGSFSPAFLNVLLLSILFLFLFMVLRKYYLREKYRKKFFLSILFSCITFFTTYGAIFFHFWWMGELRAFNEFYSSFIFLMGFSYFLSYMLFAYFSENIIRDHEIKERVIAADKIEIISELAASIAHEVRNPLTVVKGFLQLNQKDGVTKKEHMDLLLSEIEEANRVITNYLDFAKPEIHEQEPIDMSVFLKETIDLLAPFATLQGVSLKRSIEEDLHFIGDSSRIRQALVNIIKNGVEASGDNGVVSVNAFSYNQQLRIDITDSGPGLTKEQMNQLGQPYYSTKTKGTGLGLMVTFKLIRAMSGDVLYKSKIGEGTTATVILPLLKD